MKSHTLSILAFLISVPSSRAATLYYVENYRSEVQSPLHEGITNGQITFTNFGSGSAGFPTPFYTITPLEGVSLATPFSYSNASVDGDDGSVDGVASGGGTCLRTQSTTRPRFVFNFTPDAQGHYPRYFGAVLVVKTLNVILPNVTGEVLGAKDAFGADIYTDYFISTPDGFFDPNDVRYATFIGFYNENGISQVSFKNAVCLDHLQFGYSIPEPSLIGVPALALVCRRRRSNPQLAHNRKRA